MTATANDAPGSRAESRRRSAPRSPTASPSIAVITSPARRPAAAATVSSPTCRTRTPAATPKYPASWPSMDSPRMPSRARPATDRKARSTKSGSSSSANGCPRHAKDAPGPATSTRGRRVVQAERGRSAGVTVRVIRAPARSTVAGTARPAGVSRTIRVNCRTLRMRSPSNSTTTSPASMPAAAAGAPSATSVTSAPSSAAAGAAPSSMSRTVTPTELPPAPGSKSARTRSRASAHAGPRASCALRAGSPPPAAPAAAGVATSRAATARRVPFRRPFPVVVALRMIPPPVPWPGRPPGAISTGLRRGGEAFWPDDGRATGPAGLVSRLPARCAAAPRRGRRFGRTTAWQPGLPAWFPDRPTR